MSEKTEKPTEKRIRDSRNKGQVIKSQELTIGVQLATLLCYFLFAGEKWINGLHRLMDTTLIHINLPINAAMSHVTSAFCEFIVHTLGVVSAILLIATVVSLLAQVGFLIATEAMQLKLDKLNPVNNLKQILSLRTLFEFVKSLCKIGLLSLIFVYILRQYAHSFQFLPSNGIIAALPVATTLIIWLWGALVAAYVIFALADYYFQRYSVMKQLKMSKDEIKREYKEQEGSPEIKARRQETHREIQSGSLSIKVKKSTVLISNPYHIAICLYYRPGETPLPQVLEKGVDKRALLMMQIALNVGVPIIQNISLAHALMREVKVDHYIPPHLFQPVAVLLRMVMGLNDQQDNLIKKVD